jgi:cell division septation protein DedD
MKRNDLKENSSVVIISKWLVIIAVLITSSLSFTLGYLVGKKVSFPVVNQTSVIPEQEITEQKNIKLEEKATAIQQPQQTQEIHLPGETQQKEIQQSQQKKKTKGTEGTKEVRKIQEPQKIPKTRKYTVQAGAFNDISDANALKARLDKKGYKTYITSSEIQKHKKFYKVRIGNFATRKEAEIISIKIKKTEGLNTFVTFKTEQEDLR